MSHWVRFCTGRGQHDWISSVQTLDFGSKAQTWGSKKAGLFVPLFQLFFQFADVIIVAVFPAMAFITEAEFFTLLYKIKIYCAFRDVKKIYYALPTTFALVAVWVRNASRPCFIAIFW
jgi:hypothetical protein